MQTHLTFFLLTACFADVLLGQSRPPVVLTDEGRRVHFEGFVFDGHNDLPWEMRSKADSSFDKRDISQPQPKMHTDIPRLRAGGVGAQFWSVYVPAETAKKGTSLNDTLEQIQLVKTMIARYPDGFQEARPRSPIRTARLARSRLTPATCQTMSCSSSNKMAAS